MAPNTDRFMERQHERRMEQQGQGLSARAQRRAQQAERRREQQRLEREAEREALLAQHRGGTVTGRLSGMDRAMRYAQMYGASSERIAQSLDRTRADIANAMREHTRQHIEAAMRGVLSNIGVDMGHGPSDGLSEDERTYHRERSRIVNEIMDARYLRGHSGEDFEGTIVRLARELVALEDEHERAEAQKQRRSVLGIERRLGLDDF